MKPASEYYSRQEAWSSKEDLEWLLELETNVQAQEIELATCSKNPWRWLTHWAQTEDAQNKEHPFQPFPNKIHLQCLTEFWMKERYLLIPKSRQLTITWLFCGLYLWESMFYPSRLTIFQNKKEEDASNNIKRALVIHERLPKWMRDWQPIAHTYCNLSFPRSRSEIKGVPAGSHHVRGVTATGLFCDEAAFIDELGDTIAAAKPALGKIGKFTCVSSASPGYFADLVFDKS